MASWQLVVPDWGEDPNDEDHWTAEGDTAEEALESWAEGLDNDVVEEILKGSLAVLMRSAGSGDWKGLRLRADAVIEFMAEEVDVDLRWETADGWSHGTIPGEDEPAYTCELGEDCIWRAEGPNGEDLGWGELEDVQGFCLKHHRRAGGG